MDPLRVVYPIGCHQLVRKFERPNWSQPKLLNTWIKFALEIDSIFLSKALIIIYSSLVLKHFIFWFPPIHHPLKKTILPYGIHPSIASVEILWPWLMKRSWPKFMRVPRDRRCHPKMPVFRCFFVKKNVCIDVDLGGWWWKYIVSKNLRIQTNTGKRSTNVYVQSGDFWGP